jgi:hypothetical protein
MSAGVVRVSGTGPGSSASMYMRFRWDVSRTGRLGGVQIAWAGPTPCSPSIRTRSSRQDPSPRSTEGSRLRRQSPWSQTAWCVRGVGPAARTTRNVTGQMRRAWRLKASVRDRGADLVAQPAPGVPGEVGGGCPYGDHVTAAAPSVAPKASRPSARPGRSAGRPPRCPPA